MSAQTHFQAARSLFREHGDPTVAQGQMAYMRNQFEYLGVAGSKEFFLQKGAGWALRQYARVHPEAVLMFVNGEKLAPLTKREALKHL